jgi:transposase
MREGYRIAGIDVHKKMLAVVVADAAVAGEWVFQRRKFGTGDSELKALSQWLGDQGVREAVMESTAQYWKVVWRQLEGQCRLSLAQAHSNRAPRGRKQDFQDAERLVRRHVSGELILSFVPDPEQRMWRTITRTKHQLTRDRVRLYGQLEALLEDARLKLGTRVSDLLGVSSRRILLALADGQTDPAVLAAMAEPELQATPEQLMDSLQAAPTLSPLHRQILKLFLERVELLEKQMATLTQSIATALQSHQQAVLRLASVPGYGIDSAQQVIAEVGPSAASFPSAGELASWVGVIPGKEESAEVSKSNRSPKGNRAMRRVLNQVANAAVKTKGSIFESLFRRLRPRLGHKKAIWAIAHRLCRLTWKILYQGVEYIEYGEVRNSKMRQKRTAKIIRELKALGYQVILPALPQQA